MAKFPINVLFSREHSQLNTAIDILPDDRFKVIACPTIQISAVHSSQQLDQDFAELLTADYLIFTSQHAVIETMRNLSTLGISTAQLKALTICAVGPMVARQLAEYGLSVDMIPEVHTAQSLGDLFLPVARGSKKIFFPKGNRAAATLEQNLSEKGYRVVSPIIYQTELRSVLEKQAQVLFDEQKVDCFVFTSPSSVQALLSILMAQNNLAALGNTVICAIGTTTYQACLDAGLTVSIMPNDFSIAGLARAIESFYLTSNSN
jgi:uroporphyrinogen-III synthase